MARIKRYVSQKTVPLLRSQQAALLSPAQAAATEQAKFAAIGAGINTIGAIHDSLAQTRAEEQLSQATTGLEGDLRMLDQEIDQTEMTVRDDGTIEYNADEVLHGEQTRRRELVQERRNMLTSARALKAFDRYTAELFNERDAAVALSVDETQRDVDKANGMQQVYSMRRHGQFDLANARAKAMLESGVLTAADYTNERLKNQQARDNQVIQTVLQDKDGSEYSESEIMVLAESLEEGKWSPLLGLENPTIELTQDEITTSINQLYSHAASLDDRAADARKAQQDDNFVSALSDLEAEGLNQNQVANAPPGYWSNSDRKWLYNKAGEDPDTKSDPQILRQAEGAILDLMHFGASPDKVRAARALLRHEGMTYKDSVSLNREIESTLNLLASSGPDRRILDAETVKLAGITSKTTVLGTTDDKRAERMAAEDMSRQYWADKLASPDTFDGAAWMAANKHRYYREALRGVLRQDYEINIDTVPLNEAQGIALIEEAVEASVDKNAYDADYTSDDAYRDAMIELENLLENAWESAGE